jgi:cytochrome c
MDVLASTPIKTHPRPGPAHFRGGARIALLALTFLSCPNIFAADAPTGEQIYRKRCAACHGVSGEGTKEHRQKPLAGDRSVAQLAKLIAKTMPKDEPGTCTAEDADKVSAYIYDAFYSTAARGRNKPPRIELSRLTVRQYQTRSPI